MTTMLPVIALAIATTLGIRALPRALHRSSDAFRWGTGLKGAPLWLAAASIVSFSTVVIAGRAFGLAGAALGSALLLGYFAWWFQRRFGTARRFQTLCAALSTATATESSETALRAIEAELARHREAMELHSNGYEAWAQWTLHAAARASLAGHTADALRWTEEIEGRRVSQTTRNVHLQYSASFRLTLGDRSAVRELLASASRPVEPAAMEIGLQTLEALLEALEGDPAAALARADKVLAAATEPTVKMALLAARAHALEASGAHPEARALLHAIRAEHGDVLLKRIASHRGPASGPAEALLASQAPYR
jgi:hypothetical protein